MNRNPYLFYLAKEVANACQIILLKRQAGVKSEWLPECIALVTRQQKIRMVMAGGTNGKQRY